MVAPVCIGLDVVLDVDETAAFVVIGDAVSVIGGLVVVEIAGDGVVVVDGGGVVVDGGGVVVGNGVVVAVVVVVVASLLEL